MNTELQDELRSAQKALYLTRLQLARYGINAPVHLIMEAEDLEQKVGQLQRALGQTPTEPRVLPNPPRREYTPPVEPPAQFQERMVGQQERDRQADIEHQAKLLSIHRRNLGVLRQQAKALGAHAPFYVQSQIMDARESIASIKDLLRSRYGQAVEDLAGDA